MPGSTLEPDILCVLPLTMSMPTTTMPTMTDGDENGGGGGDKQNDGSRIVSVVVSVAAVTIRDKSV